MCPILSDIVIFDHCMFENIHNFKKNYHGENVAFLINYPIFELGKDGQVKILMYTLEA